MTENLFQNSIDVEKAKKPGGRGCSCGEKDTGIPEVDVQTIPHAVRHGAIFGMLDSLGSGTAIVLSATHNPIPLIKQLEHRSPGIFEATYLEEGPDRWKLKVERVQ